MKKIRFCFYCRPSALQSGHRWVRTFSGGPNTNTGATATSALFSKPTSLAIAASGKLNTGDRVSDRIRQITSVGMVTTLAGSIIENTNATGTSAGFNYTVSIAVNASCLIYPQFKTYEKTKK